MNIEIAATRNLNIWSQKDQIFNFRQIAKYSTKNIYFQKIQKHLFFTFILQVDSTESVAYRKRTVHLKIWKFSKSQYGFWFSPFIVLQMLYLHWRNSIWKLKGNLEYFENFKWTVLFRYTTDSVDSTCKMKVKNKCFWIFWN